MIRSGVVWAVLGIALSGASSAAAQVLVYDGFDYTVGENIIGQINPGNQASTVATYDDAWLDPTFPTQPNSASDPQDIVEGSLNYSGFAAPTGDSLSIPASPNANIARLTLPLFGGAGSYAPGNNNVGDDGLFFSFTMKMTAFAGTIGDAATAVPGGGQLAGFHAGPFSNGNQSGMGTGASFGGQLRIRKEVVEGLLTGNYQLGIVVNNSAGDPPPTDWYTGDSYGLDETVLVVGNYVWKGSLGDDDEVNLWINPTPGAPAPAPLVTSSIGVDVQLGGFTAIRSFWLRSDGTLGPGDLVVDELRIGQTFADVTPAGEAVTDADFNDDGNVDAADYVFWRKNTPGQFTVEDYNTWVSTFGTTVSGSGSSGTVPEPSTLVGVLIAVVAIGARRTRR